MSILIKGLKMPKTGELLCINIYPDGKVCINLDLDCKQIATAAPVPPHGRLIDADALLAAFEEDISKQDKHMELLESVGDMKSYFNISKLQIGMTSCRRLLDNAPTVIEAEGEE